MQARKRRTREAVVVDGEDRVAVSSRQQKWPLSPPRPRRQHRQGSTNAGISWCWRSLLLFSVLTTRCAESFQFAGPSMESRCHFLQRVSFFVSRHDVGLQTTNTALLDSERRMDIDISFGKSAIMASNDTRSQLLTERQLFNTLDSSSSLLAADVSMPTENGGYSHTTASRAKISAANKGKTPWNKGRHRSEEVKAKIAAGVRAKNRERFLGKLADMGITEEEYEEQKKAERRKKDAERRARKTENGGFRPTDETRQKISQVLKEKYAKGEIKRREVDPSKVRRGFVHSEETRRKISESLKKRWATDDDYRDTMRQKTVVSNTSDDVRKRISETLKQKWQDPEFRSAMLEKMRNRTGPKPALEKTHKEKISQAMKKLWKDKDYRQKVENAMSRRAEISALEPKKTRRKKVKKEAPKKPTVAEANAGKFKTSVQSMMGDSEKASKDTPSLPTVGADKPSLLQPIQPKLPVRKAKPPKKTESITSPPKVTDDVPTKAVAPPSPPASPPKKKKMAVVQSSKTTKNNSEPRHVPTSPVVIQKGPGAKIASTNGAVNGASTTVEVETSTAKTTTVPNPSAAKMTTTATKMKQHGSVSRLREERRDLYDLLYGEEEPGTPRTRSTLASIFELDDENLDTFDPYGLDDF